MSDHSQCGEDDTSLPRLVYSASLFLALMQKDNPTEGYSESPAVDSTPQTPELQDTDQDTVRKLYERSKRTKEQNDKAAVEKAQEKEIQKLWKRINRGEEELAALEANLQDAMEEAAANGTWSSIRLKVSKNCAYLMLDRKWAKAWEIPGEQVLWILRRHLPLRCLRRGHKKFSDQYFRVGSLKQRDYMRCYHYTIVYRKPGFLERLLDMS